MALVQDLVGLGYRRRIAVAICDRYPELAHRVVEQSRSGTPEGESWARPMVVWRGIHVPTADFSPNFRDEKSFTQWSVYVSDWRAFPISKCYAWPGETLIETEAPTGVLHPSGRGPHIYTISRAEYEDTIPFTARVAQLANVTWGRRMPNVAEVRLRPFGEDDGRETVETWTWGNPQNGMDTHGVDPTPPPQFNGHLLPPWEGLVVEVQGERGPSASYAEYKGPSYRELVSNRGDQRLYE
jgi:hypothetical protein